VDAVLDTDDMPALALVVIDRHLGVEAALGRLDCCHLYRDLFFVFGASELLVAARVGGAGPAVGATDAVCAFEVGGMLYRHTFSPANGGCGVSFGALRGGSAHSDGFGVSHVVLLVDERGMKAPSGDRIRGLSVCLRGM
jgi:hypothetical protein